MFVILLVFATAKFDGHLTQPTRNKNPLKVRIFIILLLTAVGVQNGQHIASTLHSSFLNISLWQSDTAFTTTKLTRLHPWRLVHIGVAVKRRAQANRKNLSETSLQLQ